MINEIKLNRGFLLRDINESAEAQSPIDPENETKGGKSTSPKSARKMGTLLTFWLAFLILANAYGILRTILDISSHSVPLSLPLWASIISIVGPVLIVISLTAILMWKKWGFYMFCAIVVFEFAVNLTLELGVFGSLGLGLFAFIGLFAGLVEIGITYLLLRSSWSLLQ